jgi:hypothetical protein
MDHLGVVEHVQRAIPQSVACRSLQTRGRVPILRDSKLWRVLVTATVAHIPAPLPGYANQRVANCDGC